MAKVTSKNDSSASSVLDTSAEAFKKAFTDHIHHTLARNEKTVAEHEKFLAVAYAVRDRLIDRWIQTQETYYNNDVKRVYYLSLEFLIGRTLGNSVLNLDVEGAVNEALHELSMDLEELREQEVDAGLGNGGLGRLAACFLDSMATLELPATGMGIRYEYGMFHQKIQDGQQEEHPEAGRLHLPVLREERGRADDDRPRRPAFPRRRAHLDQRRRRLRALQHEEGQPPAEGARLDPEAAAGRSAGHRRAALVGGRSHGARRVGRLATSARVGGGRRATGR